MEPLLLKSTVGIRSFSLHFRTSAILRTTKCVAEVWTKKCCGSAVADLLNLTSALQQHFLFLGSFSLLNMFCNKKVIV
jgi:hypothetical protein